MAAAMGIAATVIKDNRSQFRRRDEFWRRLPMRMAIMCLVCRGDVGCLAQRVCWWHWNSEDDGGDDVVMVIELVCRKVDARCKVLVLRVAIAFSKLLVKIAYAWFLMSGKKPELYRYG